MGKGLDRTLTGFVMFFVRHWLAILIALVVLFTAPIVVVPFLESTNILILKQLSELVFHLYGGPVCHQLPERSLFIFGYQMTVCSRCFAIYAAFLAGCILFAFVRTKLKPWSIIYFILLCVPMAIDGTTQLFGIEIPRRIGSGWELIWIAESTNELRIITGAIFGLAGALYVLPFLQAIFNGDEGPAPGVKVVQPDNSQGPASK
ncbi:MAG TPA: DUF2085 domain-containing protein [Methanocella sp.]|jgi:uncharacterized membrane protein